MPSPRDIRRRIKSVSSTAQITKAMQMVAASKMRKAQQGALTARPFAQMLYRIQRRATTHAADFTHPLLEVREVRKRAVILVGTDKGLCGALNSNLFREAAQFDPPVHGFHHGRAQSRPIRRPHPAAAGRRVHLRGHAAFPRGQSDCRLCPGPVFEGRSGPGRGCRDAVHQHADPAGRFVWSFCRWAKSRHEAQSIRGAESEEELAADTTEFLFEPRPGGGSRLICFGITSTFTFTRSCWRPKPANTAPAWWP